MTIATCLWFDTEGERAAELYTSLVPDSEITEVSRYPEGSPQAGQALVVAFTLAGQRFQALNGGPQFPPTEAASIVVSCDGQAEVDRYWDALIEGGEPSQCGWLKDRFGVSWQVVPSQLPRLLMQPDADAGQRVFAAMMTMQKIDIAALEAADAG